MPPADRGHQLADPRRGGQKTAGKCLYTIEKTQNSDHRVLKAQPLPDNLRVQARSRHQALKRCGRPLLHKTDKAVCFSEKSCQNRQKNCLMLQFKFQMQTIVYIYINIFFKTSAAILSLSHRNFRAKLLTKVFQAPDRQAMPGTEAGRAVSSMPCSRLNFLAMRSGMAL